MRWIKFKFKNYQNNHFILWLFISILMIAFLVSFSEVFLKFLFFAFMIVLLGMAYRETRKKSENRISDSNLRKLDHLFLLKIKLDVRFSLWVIGITFIFFSLFMLLFIGNIFIIPTISTIAIVIFAQFGIAFSIMLLLIGGLGKAIYQNYEKLFRIILNLGIILIIIFSFLLIYPYLVGFPLIFELTFYLSLLIGLTLILAEEILIKNRLSYIIISLLISLITIIFFLDYILQLFDFYFNRMISNPFALKHFSISNVLGIAQQIVFIILFLLIIYYLIDYGDLSKEENYKDKELLQNIVKLLFMCWIIIVAIYGITIL